MYWMFSKFHCVCMYKLVCKFELGHILYIYSRPISFKNIWFPFYSLVLIIRKDNHPHLAQRHPYKDNRKKKKLLYTIYKEIVDVWIDWIFHSHISVYIYRHTNVCVRKTGRKRHPSLYLSSYRFLIHSILQKKFCFYYFAYVFLCSYYVSMRRVARYIRQLCPEYLSSILRADYICEFDLFKTAGKISIFLRHHVYGSSQKKKALTCVCRR
jgi:hypothetical protein